MNGLPRRWHKCKAAIEGFSGGLFIDRCACGGTRVNMGPWIEKNSYRKEASK